MFGELSRFFRSLTGVIDGFGERTRAVAALLADPQTGFLIVTSAEREPAREAVFLAERLDQAGMRRDGLIINRVHSDGLGGRSVGEVQALLNHELGDGLARRVAANLADFDLLAKRDREMIAGLAGALDEREPILVPHLDQEIQDLLGLSRIAEKLLP
jgi:anion-transporting  ArsA/GET3 family ATPase